MNARKALDFLLKIQISGLPVIDKQKKLIGMFTEKGIIKTLLPGYIDEVDNFMYQDHSKVIKQKVAALATMTVKDLMRREVITINEETALSEVARVMITQQVRRLPVLNKDKQVIGIVAREDVVKAFLSKEYN